MAASARRQSEGLRRRRKIALRLLQGIALVAFGFPGVAAQIDFETPHCGKRFRIASHITRPFINVDPTKCVDQRCPPEAFGEDGGFTYNLLMDEVLPILKRQCKDAGLSEDVEFAWYLPTSENNLASNAVKMLCNGNFKDLRSVDQTSRNASLACPADSTYNGPSNFGECDYIGDPTCASPGPDMVAGAVHILRERLDLIDFSAPFLTVQQVVVKNRTEEPPDFMNVFKCFAFDLWAALFLEIIVVWVLILFIESHANDQITKETWFAPFYDSWFWAFGSSFNAGGPGKSPVTVAGRVFLLGHYFLMVVIVATYTGAFGPFLESQGDNIVKDFDSLAYDGKSVVVRGPMWDSEVAEAPFLGKHVGGNSETSTARSSQFELLQTTMRIDSAANFQIWTTAAMDTYWDGKLIEPRMDLDPCLVSGAVWGAYDMVKCRKALTSVYYPEALIFDAPSVFYELNRRYENTGLCELVTIGPQFSPTGFGFGFVKTAPISLPFSRAVQELLQTGIIEKYEKRYRIRRQDSLCSEDWEAGADQMTIQKLFGLVVFTIIGILLSCAQGLHARWKKQDLETQARLDREKEEREAAEAEAAAQAEKEAAEAAAAEGEEGEDNEDNGEDDGEGEGDGNGVPSQLGMQAMGGPKIGRPGAGMHRSFKRETNGSGSNTEEDADLARLGSFRSGNVLRVITPRRGIIPKESLSERVQMLLPQADRLEQMVKSLQAELPAIPKKVKKDNAAELAKAVHAIENDIIQRVESVTGGVHRTLSGAGEGAERTLSAGSYTGSAGEAGR